MTDHRGSDFGVESIKHLHSFDMWKEPEITSRLLSFVFDLLLIGCIYSTAGAQVSLERVLTLDASTIRCGGEIFSPHSIHLPSAQVLSIESDLVVTALQEVVIDGSIFPSNIRQFPGQSGQSITVVSAQKIEINGQIACGDGAAGFFFREPGGDGGSITLIAPTIIVRQPVL